MTRSDTEQKLPVLEEVVIENEADYEVQFDLTVFFDDDHAYSGNHSLKPNSRTVPNSRWPSKPGYYSVIGFSVTDNNYHALTMVSENDSEDENEDYRVNFRIKPQGDVTGSVDVV